MGSDKAKPTLVELIAQIISITKEDKIRKSDMFWKRNLSKADCAVYSVLLALKYPGLFRCVGIKKRPLKYRRKAV